MDGPQNTPQEPEPAWQFKPGETISPRTTQAPPVAQSVPVAPEAQPSPVVQPQPAPTPAAPSSSTPVAEAQPQPVQPPAPITEAVTPSPEEQAKAYQPADPEDSVSWTASEFIAHHKTAGWHFLLLAASVIFAVLVWFLFKDVLSVLVVVAAGGILSLYGARKPQQLQYRLDSYGLTIGQRHFGFDDFRAFSMAPEGAFASIALVPSKRFAPLISLYYDPQDEGQILGILGAHLPQQEHRVDAVDSFMQHIRF